MLKKIICLVFAAILMTPSGISAKESQSNDTTSNIVLDFGYYVIDTHKNSEEYSVREEYKGNDHIFTLTNKSTNEEEKFIDRLPEVQTHGQYVSRTNVHQYKIGYGTFECAIGLNLYVDGMSFVQINSYNKGVISSLDSFASVQPGSASITITPATKLPTTKLSVSAYCVSEVDVNISSQVGISAADLINMGYTKSSNVYYRKSKVENYDIRVPY